MKEPFPYTCQECDAEFDVNSDLSERVEFCPYCGEMIYDNEPDDYNEFYDDEEDEEKE
jgi:DNA-directed RNA polymerase subunit RPC12/RpoP